MKRDFNLIRALLLEIEDLGVPTPEHYTAWNNFKARDLKNSYHLALMLDGGLISGSFVSLDHEIYGIDNMAITMKGHDFLTLCRKQDLWDAVMQETNNGEISYENLCVRLNWHDCRISTYDPEDLIDKTNT